MQRRNSTKFHYLDRRKSASSAKSVHLEYIHPETAERDAQAAASQAFARARARSNTDTTLWPPPRNNDQTRAVGSSSTPDRCNYNSPIKRQQSVRFVREHPSHSIRSNTIVENTTPASTTSTARGRTGRDCIEPRLPTSVSAAGMASAAKGAAGDYINALFTSEEYYTPEDDIASVPSSYRKIRKSRSMFTCSEASIASRGDDQSTSSVIRNQLPSMSASSLNRGVGESTPAARLKAPKSMSFLRGRYDQSMLFSKRRGSVPIALSNNENIKTRSNMETPIKSQPLAFSRSKSINAEKSLRKSMRDGSNDTISMDGKVRKDGSLRNRARKVSNSFKHRLKSLFNLVKGDSDEAEFPPQHIEASKSHIMDPGSLGYTGHGELQFDPTGDEAAISRVPSGVPSLHAVPSYQQLRSRQGSLKSLRSERRVSDERSRVTSWSNSETNTLNTLGSQKNEWDRQRLSVIKENGMHVSSSSARPGTSIYGTSPDTSVRSFQPPLPPRPVPIDSQRIYSALMKRLNDTNKHSQRSEPQRPETVDGFIDTDAVPLRGSSRARDYEKRSSISRATIRHVNSDDPPDASPASKTQKNWIINGPRLDVEPDKSPFHTRSKLDIGKRELWSPTSTIRTCEVREPTGASFKSPPIPHIEKPSSPVKTLSTRSSAFFASPTCHLFRTRSPYRRALQNTMKSEPQSTRLRSPEFNPWMRSLTSLPIRCPSTCESEVDKKLYYTESVYSCTTEEPPAGSLNNNTPAVTENYPRHSTNHGDATIFVNPPVYRPTPPPPPPPLQQRVASSASSVEWKTWLSANISKLEGQGPSGGGSTGTGTDTNIIEYAVPSTRASGHVREKAQINDEDEQIPLEVYRPTRPDSALATIDNHTRAPPQTPRNVPNSSPGYDCGKENEIPERPTTATTTTVLSKSMLRTTPSLSSVRSAQGAPAATTVAKTATEPSKKGASDSVRWRSLAHKPSLSVISGNSTPPPTTTAMMMTSSTMKLVRRTPGSKIHATTPTPSPGFELTVDKNNSGSGRKKGGSTAESSRRIFGAMTMVTNKPENVSPKDGNIAAGGVDGDADADPYGIQGSGVLGPGAEVNPQSIGSKKMVNLFLSSRRKRMASGEDGGVFS
ncbi:uncharacterized protein F4812DRAFT_464502 [Daldinia caldariorum]|uniref:uncharacterized protein n=1 Tax=Daldinia caldariorum TaxID=326644 RepID=UPI00200866A1|nr:uncharacterized protein F4812DRAFT_464502 [Daldinia caldariorum]KAI1472382.1 hypothetical protein F4812DRAFT_464502 [Daldinia caldariorum]